MSKKISAKKKEQIIAKTGGMCAYCGVVLYDDGAADTRVTIDHLTPKSRGGTNEFSNLVVSCRSCNSMKGIKTLDEFRFWFTWADICREAGFSLSQLNWVVKNTDLTKRYPREEVRFFFEGAGL